MADYFMCTPAGTPSHESTPPVLLRPERPEDEAFLFAVYAGTREEELALTNWNEDLRRAFLNQQFNAMRQGYRSQFPTGEFLVIESAGKPIGRMVIHRTAAEIRVVDLALLPAHRNQGIGTWLLRRVCAQADRPVHLSVLKFNRAVHWYERLGFTKISEQGIYDEMEWRSAAANRQPTV
jgi:ribosomal protein S18 acetylase RimI-like enzyme